MPTTIRRRSAARLVLAAACAITLLACQPGGGVPPGFASASAGPLLGYSAETHAKLARPSYAAALPQDRVPQLRIKVEPASWQAMLDDMTKNFGARGNGELGRPAGALGGPGLGGSVGGAGPRGMGDDGPSGSTVRPMWAGATLTYEGRVWDHVGIRFKGNSSLRSAWQSGGDRIPFKLDFDQLTPQYPAVKGQRFHGFKQLALSSNWNDNAQMREAIVYDLLADAGLAAAETAFYEVVLDHGAGEVSLGLYSAIEVIDDTVVPRVFGDAKGNIYEGDGAGVTLAAGTRERLKASFPKENNKDSDWKDLEALYDVLHDPLRMADPAAWREQLEAIFDVDVFLRWLAIAAVVEHWDTYGGMTHNFYLYNNPATGKLTWISWDHNLVLGAQGAGGMMLPGGGPPAGQAMPAMPIAVSAAPSVAPSAVPAAGASGDPALAPPRRVGGGGMGRNASLGKAEVTNAWPLIRFLLDDPHYYAIYVSYLGETIKGPFEPTKMKAKYARLADLLAPVAGAADGGVAFRAAVDALSTATDTRVKAVQDFLATPAAVAPVNPVVGPQ